MCFPAQYFVGYFSMANLFCSKFLIIFEFTNHRLNTCLGVKEGKASLPLSHEPHIVVGTVDHQRAVLHILQEAATQEEHSAAQEHIQGTTDTTTR